MSYKEKLLDPRWQKKRLQVLEKSEWRCECCKDSESTLHVHHVYYENNLNPWEYDDSSLVVLCDTCHEFEHEALRTALSSLLKTMTKAGIRTSDDISYLESVIREKFKKGVFHG